MSIINNRKVLIICSFLIVYLIICQSCMRMRTNGKKTKEYFNTAKISYLDSTVHYKDFNIHYIQTGKKEAATLCFIHGSPGSWDAYKMYLKDNALVKKYRMIAIDRPGFGYSNFGNAEDLETQAERISRFIKSIDNKKPITLIGHSMGGPVITKMAALEPKLYTTLVILAGSIDPNAEKPEIWRSFINKKPIRYLIPGALRPSNDELWWLKDDLINLKKELPKISSSIIVIHGTKDQLVPYSNMHFIKKEFDNSNLIDTISIKNADHFIPWSHFELIKNRLLLIEK